MNTIKLHTIIIQGIFFYVNVFFGIGEGLSFIYWDSKQMGFPFLGGRCKQDVLTENIAKRLNLKLEVKETSSKAKAWESEKQPKPLQSGLRDRELHHN